VTSVPYPFFLKMAKVQLEGEFLELRTNGVLRSWPMIHRRFIAGC
jgi:hypothetical protein